MGSELPCAAERETEQDRHNCESVKSRDSLRLTVHSTIRGRSVVGRNLRNNFLSAPDRMLGRKGEKVDQERTPYQALLRVIGRELDHRHATGVRVMEVPSGFEVHYVTNDQSLEVGNLSYSYEDLKAKARGSRIQPLLRHPMGGKRSKKGKPTYQDFFRALGYELEDASAYAILLDELDDGYLLTYQFYNPDSGFMLHKHRVALHADEAGEIVNVAGMRRGRVTRKQGA
jgi:hypothetical protein